MGSSAVFVNAGLFPLKAFVHILHDISLTVSQEEIPFTNYRDSYCTLPVVYSYDNISDLVHVLNFGPIFCKEWHEGSRKYQFMKYGKLPG